MSPLSSRSVERENVQIKKDYLVNDLFATDIPHLMSSPPESSLSEVNVSADRTNSV